MYYHYTMDPYRKDNRKKGGGKAVQGSRMGGMI